MNNRFSRAVTVVAAATTMASLAFVAPASALADSANASSVVPPAAAAQPAAAPEVVAQSNPFSDVPPNSWAYQAVQQLSADGYIQGYPDGTFKGQRPLTRYEMAVIVNRAVQGIERAMAAQKPAAAAAPSVSPADLAAIRRLVDAFGTELKSVENKVAALQREADSTKSEADATAREANDSAYRLKRASIGINMWNRPGVFEQNVQAFNGPTALSVPSSAAGCAYTYTAATGRCAVPANAVLPGGLGPAPLGAGILGNVGPGTGGTQQNGLTTGVYNHSTDWDDVRLAVTGQPDPRFAYAFRLEDKFYPSNAPNYLSITKPAYCTSTTALSGGLGCSTEDYDKSLGVAVNYAWFGYFSPGGFYAKLGRLSQDEGVYNAEGWTTAGAQQNGIQLGYIDSRTNAWVQYDIFNSALTNQDSSTCSVLAPGGVIANCNSYQTAAIVAKADYWFPSSQTDIGATYDGYYGVSNASWNGAAGLCTGGQTTLRPIAGLCPGAGNTYIATALGPVTGAYQTAQTNVDVASAFISQFFGPHERPLFRVTVEGTHRFGNDPFSVLNAQQGFGAPTGWNGPNSLYVQGDYASKGNLKLGPLYPAQGIRGSNVVEAVYWTAGLNSLGVDNGIGGTTPFYSFYYGNGNGMQGFYIALERWFTESFRAGFVYEHFGTQQNVAIPAGSVSCPGCSVSGLSSNAIFFDNLLVF